MARARRVSAGGYSYHVINRGNGGALVFCTPGEYDAFIQLIEDAGKHVPMRVVGYCLMPNHFHLALWPAKDGALSRWMQWLTPTHVRRFHRDHRSAGHVWQGRFKAFPIQEDDHLVTVLRYIERNPVRANLVGRAEGWQWASAQVRAGRSTASFLHPSPVVLPPDWLKFVNQPASEKELASVRQSVIRGTPYGEPRWKSKVARRLGIEATLRPLGRPRLRSARVVRGGNEG